MLVFDSELIWQVWEFCLVLGYCLSEHEVGVEIRANKTAVLQVNDDVLLEEMLVT